MCQFRKLIVFCLAALVTGCATAQRYPTNVDEQVTVDLKIATDSAQRGDLGYPLYFNINNALGKPTGPDRVRTLFATNAAVADAYKSYLTSEVNVANETHKAIPTKRLLDRAASVFPAGALQPLDDVLERRVTVGNMDGSIAFVLDDDYKVFASLRSPAQERQVVENTISRLQGHTSQSRPLNELMAYAKSVGPTSTEGLRIGQALGSMNVRRSELPEVARVYPQFAESLAANIALKVLLKVEPPDRLFREDLLTIFRRRLSAVELVELDGPQVVSVTIERLRYNEQKLPDRTETITYGQSEVNVLLAVLAMPRNASYLYEVTTGGAEIEYGFAVKANQAGKQIADDLLRDRVTASSTACTNARIQNVFGGVQRADFVANDDMARRCSGGGGTANIEDLRTKVYEKIVEQVAKLPPIARALN